MNLVKCHYDNKVCIYIAANYYGLGVYFAVNAVYSAQSTYSPPDSQGNRYMYLARVLTGEYTEGDEGMTVPPPKDPKKPTVTYDTVVNDVSNPEVFVAFYDWQCYPEYLITFQ
jgi:poly [ADP-ribose] polymerase 10/14/15